MPAAGRAVDLSAFKPNRAQRRVMARANAGRLADLLVTRTGSMVWVGIANAGRVKLTPDEARQWLARFELVVGEAEHVLDEMGRELES